MKTRYQLLVLGVLLIAFSRVNASTVGWVSGQFDTTPMLNSSGGALDASYAFELGTFGNGFIPTASNTELWATNWKMLGRATAPDDWAPSLPAYGKAATFNSNGTVLDLAGSATFTTGELAYVWVYSGVEWALVTDNSGADKWLLPDPAESSNVTTYFVLSSADTVVVGGVNGIHSSSPYSSDNGGSFQLQTAVIPEPSSTLLVLLVGCLARLRRVRRR